MEPSTPGNHQDEFERASRFFTDLYNLVKSLEMYKETHPLTVENTRATIASLKELLDWRREIHISFEGNSIYIDQKELIDVPEAKSLALTRLFAQMKERNINSIIFDRSVTSSEMTTFAKAASATTTISIDARDLPSYLRSKSIFSIRVNMAAETTAPEATESLLLQHFLEGSLGDTLTEPVRGKLFDEISNRSRVGSRQIMELLYREENYNHPVVARDIFVTLGEKWVHLTGSVANRIVPPDSALSPANKNRYITIIKSLIPAILGLPPARRGPVITPLIDAYSEGDFIKMAGEFDRLYQITEITVSEKMNFLDDINRLISEIIEGSQLDVFETTPILEKFKGLIPDVLNYPTLSEKLFIVVNQVRDSQFIFDALVLTLTAYTSMDATHHDITAAMRSRIIRFCTIDRSYCGQLVMESIELLTQASSDDVFNFLTELIQQLESDLCRTCANLPSCPIFEVIAERFRRGGLSGKQQKQLIDIWQFAASQLIQTDSEAFRTLVVPMTLDPFNPDNFQDPDVRDHVVKAWMSFAEAPVFQTIYKNLIVENRDVRFKTIHQLSEYGAFAIWICLAGLNSPNWHLRRNLATVMGQVVDLKQTNLLREPLRDHDWHVRLEIIKALVDRSDEIRDILLHETNHPIIKVFSMALHDGNKSIRQEMYRSIEKLKLSQVFKSLRELYGRLATVNADTDLEERVRILKLSALLSDNPEAPLDAILEFIIEVATMREGIITPNWMIPIKKGAVEALLSMNYPKAHEWLSILASQKPYKRGVVGREARSALQKLSKKQ